MFQLQEMCQEKEQALLKMVEGNVVGVPPQGGRKHPEQPLLYIDTLIFFSSHQEHSLVLKDIIRKTFRWEQKLVLMLIIIELIKMMNS